jgi:hypothetical protein
MSYKAWNVCSIDVSSREQTTRLIQHSASVLRNRLARAVALPICAHGSQLLLLTEVSHAIRQSLYGTNGNAGAVDPTGIWALHGGDCDM